MKLLPKSDILKLKQAEQKQAIDEGIKLAKRVDSLREVASIEEQKLEEFRTKTLREIQSEIEALTTTKGALEKEVSDLEERKRLALEPLDAEWKRLTDCEADLKRQTDEINAKLAELTTLEEQAKQSISEAENRVSHIQTMDQKATQLLIDADKKHTEAQTALNEAIAEKYRIEEEVRQKEQNLTNRELGCINRENSIILKEQELEKERNSLLIERIRLEDRAKTLERAFIRLKK